MPAVEVMDIASGGQHVKGTLVRPRTVAAAALFVHGWGGSQDEYRDRAHEAAAMGCLALTFDMRGHGGTRRLRGKVTREDNLHDVLAAYDVLARESGAHAPIAVVAASYGAYLAAIMTALRPVAWLGLRVPALYKDEDWNLPKVRLKEEQQLEEYRRHVVRIEDNRALRASAEFAGDVLVVESEHDDLVPHPVIQSYVGAFSRARSVTARTIPGADHALSQVQWQQTYASLLIDWMKERLREAIAQKI